MAWQTAKRPQQRLLAKHSFPLLDLLLQLLFQMTARGFLDSPPLGCYCLLLRLALSACPWFNGMRDVRDLRSPGTGVSLVWFGVRIHGEYYRCFVILPSSFIRHSTFVLRHFTIRVHLLSAASQPRRLGR
jgi:hypothetical protein